MYIVIQCVNLQDQFIVLMIITWFSIIVFKNSCFNLYVGRVSRNACIAWPFLLAYGWSYGGLYISTISNIISNAQNIYFVHLN
jgi:hypothetical protein